MERARQRKSKIPATVEGYRQNSKQRMVPQLAADSSSYRNGTTKEDLFLFESVGNSFKGVTGMPMKKLLAEEMLRETKVKRRSPNVIARLMGLDGLPSPQSIHGQQNRLSENYRQRTRSTRKNSMDEREFKDVYEDLEAAHIANPRYSSKWTTDSNLTKPETGFIQQNLRDAKRLPSDKMHHGSVEFCDTFEMLDSDKSLILQSFQQPDSLFVKHLLDRRRDPASTLCTHTASQRPSNIAKYEGNTKNRKLRRETSCKHDSDYRRKLDDDLECNSLDNRGDHSSLKPLKKQLEGKNANILPTKIVLLKPNLGETRKDTKLDSSINSSYAFPSDCENHKERFGVETREAELWKMDDPSGAVGPSRPKSREAGELAREITKQMRETFGCREINLPYNGINGYAVDDNSYNVSGCGSSYYLSGSDSSSESEVIAFSARNSLGRKNRHKPSSSGSGASSSRSFVSREAKKRLSERWKMTHVYQDVGDVGRGNTLGEMLTVPDRNLGLENLDSVTGLHGNSDRFLNSNRNLGIDSPLGISSRDGWKDSCIRSSSRSRSLPPCSGSHRKRAGHDAIVDDRYLMRTESMNCSKTKADKGKHRQKEILYKNSRSSSKNSSSSRHICMTSTESSPQTNFSEIQMTTNDLRGQLPLLSQTPAKDDVCTSSFVVDTGHEHVTNPSRSSDDLISKPSTYDLASNSQESADRLQCPGPEPESSETSKEADHPSPVSVLEVPFTEDVSSGSECFERVSADLQELRMQLQLLKMESDPITVLPPRNSSDEEVSQGSNTTFENWESSYVADVLIHSGFDHIALGITTKTWNFPNCPLDPSLFDDLEKNLVETTTVPRFERRLLFDRINSAVSEIFLWKKGVKLEFFNIWKDGAVVEEEVRKSLAAQEKAAKEWVSEKGLDREMDWLEFGNDVVGEEIEGMLMDELMVEALLTM